MNGNLRNQVVSGALWHLSARAAQQAVQFGLSVLLARLLAPDAYGAIGMIMVFTGFAGLIADAGFNSALVQRHEIGEHHIQSVFWTNLAVGCALMAIMYCAAPWIAQFYRLPLLGPLTRALSATFVITAFGMVPAALLQRRMQFAGLARANMLATLVSASVAVLLAYRGWGVWSLVVLSLSNNLILTTVNWLLAGWRPRVIFSRAAIKELWAYTANLFGYTFVNYWARNADNLLIGRAFGASALGNYTRAYGLMMLPITQIISAAFTVMFPTLASIQQDRERVRSIYLRCSGLIALVAFPMMIGLFVTAKPFVLTLYGPKWAEVIPLLRILAPVGAIQAMLNPLGWLYTSQGRTDRMFRWGLIASATLILAILLGVWRGSVMSVAAFYALANVLLLYPGVVIAGRLVNMQFAHLARAVRGPLLGSALMALVVAGVTPFIPAAWADWMRLACLILIGASVYVLFMVAFRVPAWREMIEIVRDRLAGHRQRGASANAAS